MIKILFFSGLKPNELSFYRGRNVLSKLEKTEPLIHIKEINDDVPMSDFCGYNLAIFHRPDKASQVNTIKTLKTMRIPVIVDYDDDLTTVPAHSYYSVLQKFWENDYVVNVCNALLNADMVWVSTEELKKQYTLFNKNIHIIKNAFDDYFLEMATDYNKQSRTVLWRGGHTHQQDLWIYKNSLERLIFENLDFNFIFWGRCLPDWLKTLCHGYKQKNLQLKGCLDVFSYFWQIKELRPCLTLVPLENNQFNLSKSDIAKKESIYAGALALYPKWPEWSYLENEPFSYNDPKSFYNEGMNILEEIRSESKYLPYYWTNLKNHVLQNRKLSDINKTRIDLIKELLNRSKND